ncbi:exodeoxyribonuclease VII small subunit [Candidatus Thiothrix sp. Deng01]|uniref:Exodeoxyribonuclease 7 small subunit n=1 Tax=Candidatus Thiothrix phosphatis TaxID=3112415 RepID=A0ABU6CX00_9GAMM|nr:exodeoxyribonuclease VII small subunit [Candidatus Thiothrix sp. Deng01]MEB4590613.1 exodeoxyribonuclease VII small subunit [Candidatus Thiothrix sp. Deng01]
MPKKQLETAAAPQPDFEAAMAELENLVQRMESGELTLEASLKEFERGVQLTRLCQEALNAAEQRVKLLAADGQERDFPPQEEA